MRDAPPGGIMCISDALVAQPDRASDYESEGRRFESCRARPSNPSICRSFSCSSAFSAASSSGFDGSVTRVKYPADPFGAPKRRFPRASAAWSFLWAFSAATTGAAATRSAGGWPLYRTARTGSRSGPGAEGLRPVPFPRTCRPCAGPGHNPRWGCAGLLQKRPYRHRTLPLHSWNPR